ncbi:MAG: glycosyltransferase [Candidatus Latescibacteria bacterium]|nr:glycosyltransferase [Candidatus Latescibacterota bacterium]
MRVALVHDWLTGMRGGERCLEVLCEIFPRADVFTLVHRKGSVAGAIESHTIRESWLARLPFGRSRYRWLVPLYPQAIESFDLSAYDLVVSSSHCAAKGAVTRSDTLHVCYCHTPVRYFWDLYGEYFAPGRTGPLARLLAPGIAHRFRMWDRISADRVDLYVANSRHVRDRIWKHYRRPALVVHPPVDTEFYTPGDGREPAADAPLLAVSALVPYKGVDLTIRVANRLKLPLRIVGSGPDLGRLRSIAGPTVRFESWLSREALREAYRGCRALVQAHEEDFGIAPLEALACGRPVVALEKGGALDAVTPEHGVLFREPTEAGLEAAIAGLGRRRFDPEMLRRRAVAFGRDVYRSRMRTTLEEAYAAFQRRHDDPGALERPAAACNQGQAVV